MAIGDSTRINTNIAAFNALNALKSVNRRLEISQLRLATGLRINEVADDPRQGLPYPDGLKHVPAVCQLHWTMSVLRKMSCRSQKAAY